MVACDGAEEHLPADAVLVATGRRPNVAGLTLDAAGVELTGRGAVRTDEHLRTTAPNIRAMGDVVGGLQFTYLSLDDFRIVRTTCWATARAPRQSRHRAVQRVPRPAVFARGHDRAGGARRRVTVKVAELPAAAIPKAQVLRQARTGLLKAVIDADTDHLLGVHLFCEESYEMINTAKLAIDAGCRIRRYATPSIRTPP